MSSTPAQNQSEVEEWTGQSPSAESWLVSRQQGSISERDKQAQMRRGNKISIMAHNMLIGSEVIKTHFILDLSLFLFFKDVFQFKSSLRLLQRWKKVSA